MADDNIISMLTAQTLKPADSAGFPDNEVNFQRRRLLSKLPIHAIDGEFFDDSIARFYISGEIIDIPVTFGVAQFLEGMGGVVRLEEDHEFFSVISPLLGHEVDAVFVVCANDRRPWMIFWNMSESESIETELAQIFSIKSESNYKAA